MKKKNTDSKKTTLKTKQWKKPKADTLRLGFEVTMYAGVEPDER